MGTMCFFDEASRAHVLVYGADFVVASPKSGAQRVKNKMREWYDVKVGTS